MLQIFMHHNVCALNRCFFPREINIEILKLLSSDYIRTVI